MGSVDQTEGLGRMSLRSPVRGLGGIIAGGSMKAPELGRNFREGDAPAQPLASEKVHSGSRLGRSLAPLL